MHVSQAERYAALSPAEQLVAQACGAYAPHETSVTRIQGHLAKAGIKVGGRRLGVDRIRQCIDSLVKAEIVVRQSRHSLQAAPEWELPLTRAANEDGNLNRLLAVFRTSGGAANFHDLIEQRMLLRGYLVTGDTRRLETVLARNQLGSNAWAFLAEPPAVDLLETLPQEQRDAALRECLEHAIDTAAPADAILAACHALSADIRTLIADIAFIHILQGRFDRAEAVFKELSPSDLQSKPAIIALASARALMAALRGDDLKARQLIEVALEAKLAGTRKRIAFPNSRCFALSLVALVRIDSPDSNDLLDRLLTSANRRKFMLSSELGFVRNAIRIKTGRGVFGRLPGPAHIEALFDGLVSCWLRDFHPQPQARREALAAYRERARANGYEWAAAECEEVLHRFATFHGHDHAAAEPGPASDTPLAAHATHARLGTVSLAALAEEQPDWEHSLKALEQLAYEASRKSNKKKKHKTEVPVKRRLAWRLEEEYGGIVVSPREQRQNKNGTWTKGRKTALKRLAVEAAKMDFLLPQDREVATAIVVQSGYWNGRMEYRLGDETLYALAGHPHVFNPAGESVDLVRREPELAIDKQDEGGVLVRIEPHGGELYDEYRAVMATPRRCEVTRFTPDHLALFSIIPEGGLLLPAGVKPRLLEAVSTMAASIRVHSDAAEGAISAVEVAADAEPWVRLEPQGAGLTAALEVEPIPDSGICFAPGSGGATVFASRDGENVQARRDLAAERRAVDRLIEACRPLAPRPTELEPLLLPDSAQCLAFLELIEAAGARCKWPRGEPLRIVAHASAPSLALTVKSAADWLQASGKLTIDERRVVDLKRLFELLEASPGARFLELGEGEFLALTRAFRRQLDDLASLTAPAAQGAMRLHPLAALALDELINDAEVDGDEGWRELQARLSAAESFKPVVPSTLQAELRPYQIDGFRWLARLSRWGAGACLADDMGLGKTVQTLAALLDRAADGPALVVAPTSVVANWVDEARRFAPTLNVKTYVGPASSRAALLDAPSPFDLYITTYGILQNDVDQLAAIQWHSAVLDEAQAIKNSATKRARAARRLPADFRLVTTGTPIQNNLMDLHSLFSFVNPGLLGSKQAFNRNFGLAIERDEDADARGRLQRLVAPFVLRRLKADVLDDLPERTEITLHVEMSPEEATLYEALRQRAVEELETARLEDPDVGEGARRVQVLAHLTRLRLACCNPRLVLDADTTAQHTGLASSKLQTFATTVTELLANHHKVLVFSQFVRHLKLIEDYLSGAGISYQYLDGATPAKARTARIKAFQSGDGDVFLISLRAGGVGLNLTAADYVIHMDPWWNPAVEDQASDRAHRIGQTRPVTIYRLVAEGTIEEQIVDLHRHKRELAEQLLAGADSAGRLNADELLDLLRNPLNGTD